MSERNQWDVLAMCIHIQLANSVDEARLCNLKNLGSCDRACGYACYGQGRKNEKRPLYDSKILCVNNIFHTNI